MDSPMDDASFVEACAKMWADAVIFQGERCFRALDELLTNTRSTNPVIADIQRSKYILRVEEHFFLISLGKALDWLREFGERQPIVQPVIASFVSTLPHAVDLRNMREHEEEYFKGAGRKQNKFLHETTDDLGMVSSTSDATATLVAGGDILLGGRLGVGKVMGQFRELIPLIFLKSIY